VCRFPKVPEGRTTYELAGRDALPLDVSIEMMRPHGEAPAALGGGMMNILAQVLLP